MKKFLSVLLVLSILVSMSMLLSACGEKEDDSNNPSNSNTNTGNNENTPNGNVVSGEGFQIEIPDGWKDATAGEIVMLTPENYPTESSNINVTVSFKDSNFSEYKKEDFEDIYKDIFDNFNYIEFTNTQVDGKSAYKSVYSGEMLGIEMTQTQYLIDGSSSTISITFTEIMGENSMSSIIEKIINTAKID